MTAPAHEKPATVSSIELFFDLVFAALAIAVIAVEQRLESRKG